MKLAYLLLLVCLASLSNAQKKVLNLNSWVLQIEGNPNSYNVTVPSTLTRNLIQTKLIQDPYYRDNFLQYYKYETKKVNYTTTFKPPIFPIPKQMPISLQFDGLDTHCQVFLNGKLILDAHNMFRKYSVTVGSLQLNNTLVVQFQSSALYDIQKQKEFYDYYQFKLPANYSFSRKAAYQYGWDWGPRILTVGIWKEARVVIGTYFTIQNPVITLLTPITSKNMKEIKFKISTRYNLKTEITSPTTFSLTLKLTKGNETLIIEIYKVIFTKEDTDKIYEKIFTINQSNVKNVSSYVWWTWDLGQPNLFTVSFESFHMDHPDIIEKKVIKTGFRTVTLNQNKDSTGSAFTLYLNGLPVFMRGGNYIPPQMQMSNVKKQTYLKIRDYAVFAKYNMIRVWGGGQFEHDQFYQTMDEAGILIWHDLMFACAMYPATGNGELENIKGQMEDNLWRIGHHPSIALWNGNNQVWIGWLQWGWQKGLDFDQKYEAEAMYSKIFRELLPNVINKITPDIVYWQTSPSSSSNQVSTIGSGDIHFWRVWGGGTPIQQYEHFVGRFNSQYGMQSMPQYSSILKFTAPADRVINSYILRLHERHPYGDNYLPMYTNKYAGNTTNLKRYAYYTQVMQAYALEMAIVSLRGGKPYCMGSLYWQLNDVWPVSSWATVDYYGIYKISHYRIRQLHNQLLLHLVHIPQTNTSAEAYKVFASNQYDKRISLYIQIKVMDFNGTIIQNQTVQKTVNSLDNLVIARLNVTNVNKTRSFVHVSGFNSATLQLYQNNYYFVPPVSRTIIDPQLTVSLVDKNLSITAKKLANYVWIRCKDQSKGYNFGQNYFDILPGQTYKIPNFQMSLDEIQITSYQQERLKPQTSSEKPILVDS